jgi:hypothetical protein
MKGRRKGKKWKARTKLKGRAKRRYRKTVIIQGQKNQYHGGKNIHT